jgi:hypothetical protein
MSRASPLPPEWNCLEGRVQYVQRHNDHLYSSSCVDCGGEPHHDGEWPDRFRLLSDGGKYRAFCRQCGVFYWRDELGGPSTTKYTHEELEAERQRRIAEQEARKQSAERQLQHLKDDALWRKYYERLDEPGRQHWEQRGVPRDWQDYWKLGYVDYEVYWRGQPYRTPAESIPIFGKGWTPQNLKMRLTNPPQGSGRYRYHYKDLPTMLYLTEPDRAQEGKVIVAEGEVKAMTTRIYGDVHTVGLPGKKVSDEIMRDLGQYDRLILVADPDAKKDMIRLANKVGVAKCWLLHCPEKIDDAILQYGWGKWDVQRVLSGAIRLADWL